MYHDYSRVQGHKNWYIKTAAWNLAGFLHCALKTRRQESAGSDLGSFLMILLMIFLMIFSMKILIFFMKILDFLYEKS